MKRVLVLVAICGLIFVSVAEAQYSPWKYQTQDAKEDFVKFASIDGIYASDPAMIGLYYDKKQLRVNPTVIIVRVWVDHTGPGDHIDTWMTSKDFGHWMVSSYGSRVDEPVRKGSVAYILLQTLKREHPEINF
jgi:hypothetical protein